MKVQNLTKLDIFFKGGGIIKFPVQNLKQIDVEPIDEQGGGGQEEIDVVKQYIDNFANKVGLDYRTPLGPALKGIITKANYESSPSLNIPDENKIGNYENFDYVLIDKSDAPEEPDDNYVPTFIFMNNEQFQYYNSKLIRNSLKDFILSSLSIDNIENIFNITINNEDDIKNSLAIDKNDFTFGFKKESPIQLNSKEFILDDVDISILDSTDSASFYIIFDENETRKIFTITVTSASSRYRYLTFYTDSNDDAVVNNITINNKNYKYFKLQDYS